MSSIITEKLKGSAETVIQKKNHFVDNFNLNQLL
jgi:hypothetical protein